MNKLQKKRLVIIGAGAAGLMAAAAALENFHGDNQDALEVVVLEKMNRPGRKLRISGKGRGNLTNAAEINDFINYYPGNGRFLYSALASFTNDDVRDFFARLNVESKVGRGGRVFPVSDKASDLADALVKAVIERGGVIKTGKTAEEILAEDKKIIGVRLKSGEIIDADAVIIATGGLSYPLTGSTGDGYRFARISGHKVTPLFPALVPLSCLETKDLALLNGITLKNVRATLFINGREIDNEFGELMSLDGFLAGPIILKLSRRVSEVVSQNKKIDATVSVDLKPALHEEKLLARLERDIAEKEKLTVGNLLKGLLPAALADVVARRLKLDQKQMARQMAQKTRLAVVNILKKFSFTVVGTAPIDLAIVTAGGVAVNELVPQTLESKLIKGLYFAGEVIDVDGYTGGFNLQAAWSTGHAAGLAAANYCSRIGVIKPPVQLGVGKKIL